MVCDLVQLGITRLSVSMGYHDAILAVDPIGLYLGHIRKWLSKRAPNLRSVKIERVSKCSRRNPGGFEVEAAAFWGKEGWISGERDSKVGPVLAKARYASSLMVYSQFGGGKKIRVVRDGDTVILLHGGSAKVSQSLRSTEYHVVQFCTVLTLEDVEVVKVECDGRPEGIYFTGQMDGGGDQEVQQELGVAGEEKKRTANSRLI